MIFNSVSFSIFFIVFFLLYWFVLNKNLKLQNGFILAASYVFYARADWHFLFLLAGSSAVSYFLGIYIGKVTNDRQKRLLLYLGLLQGLGTLVYFKYFNFFITSFANAFSIFHINLNIHTFQILLPLGISFYTFRTLSYIIDIYNDKTKPTRDWVVFFCYIAFFPCLISGPIDRPNLLIPQLEKKRNFTYEHGTDAMRQILWGFFKKMVIADNCAAVTNQIFDKYLVLPGSTLLLGAFFFTIEIYSDFSGYSDLAIGFARLLGFNVTQNFNYPFFAQNIADYWRRWHISLTSWVTDYVFTPIAIAFRDYGKLGLLLAIILNMLIVGIWHGANWTFVLYGFVNGLYFIPLIWLGKLGGKKKSEHSKLMPSLAVLKNILGTFTLVMLTNIIFRAESISKAFGYYRRLFSLSLFKTPVFQGKLDAAVTLFLIGLMFTIEWLHREKQHGLQIDYIKSRFLRLGIYFSLMFIIFIFDFTEQHQFIYFKF